MVGRKRKPGKRYPGGQLVKDKPPSPAEIAASMPHRRAIPPRREGNKWIDQRSDERGECPIGRLRLANFVSADQYDAAEKFRATVAKYKAVIDSPRDAPNILASQYVPPPSDDPQIIPFRLRMPMSDDEAMKRRAEYQGAVESIYGHRCRVVVNSVVIHEKELQHGDMGYLHAGLDNLKTFYSGLTAAGKSRLCK